MCPFLTFILNLTFFLLFCHLLFLFLSSLFSILSLSFLLLPFPFRCLYLPPPPSLLSRQQLDAQHTELLTARRRLAAALSSQRHTLELHAHAAAQLETAQARALGGEISGSHHKN
jgi:hypothetical protein